MASMQDGGGMLQHAMRLRTTSNKATLYQATTAAAADFSTAALPFRLKMDSLSLSLAALVALPKS